MTNQPHGGPVRRPADHTWILTGWVLPLAIAAGLTVATFGMGALTIAVAIVIGLVSTALHFGRR